MILSFSLLLLLAPIPKKAPIPRYVAPVLGPSIQQVLDRKLRLVFEMDLLTPEQREFMTAASNQEAV